MTSQREPLMLDAITVIEQEENSLGVVVDNKPLLVFTHMRPYFKSYMVRFMNLIHNTEPLQLAKEQRLNLDVSNFVLQNPILPKPYQRLRTFQIWKAIAMIGYTPPEWVWSIKSDRARNELFEKASHVDNVNERYAFIESLKRMYA
jgi:hypothetical protein